MSADTVEVRELESLDQSSLAFTILQLTLSAAPITDIVLHEDRPLKIYTPDGLRIARDVVDPATGMVVMEDEFIPTRGDMESLLTSIDPGWRTRIQHRAIDEGRSFGGSDRLRLNFYLEGNGKLAGVIRRFPVQVPTLEELQAPGMLVNLLIQRRGLILVVGQTAAGKSTTMAAMLRALSQTWATHIVTVENPIEFVHQDAEATFSQREVGPGLHTTALGVEDAMRQAPGVIYVSEIRDRDTAEAVMYAQESGHLVLATIHARNPIEGLQRLARFFPQDRAARLQALAANLVGVIGQVLIPVLKRWTPDGLLEGDGRTRIGYRAFYEVMSAVRTGHGGNNQLTDFIASDDFAGLQSQIEHALRGQPSLIHAHLMNPDLQQAIREGEVLRSDAISKALWPADLIRRTE